jgi:hypothetical protein
VLTAVVAVGACGFAAYKAFEKLGAAADGMTASLRTVNASKWGTLAEIDATLLQLRLTIDAVNKVAIHEQHQLDTYDGYGAQLFTDFHGLAGKGGTAVDAVTGTANAATGTLGQARVDLGTMNDSIAATKPLLEASTATIGRLGVASDDLDTLLKRKAIGDLLDQFAGIATHGNAIAGDFQQVADKARADYLRKTPWYLQPVKRAGDIMDISAAIARHTP